MPKEPAGGPQIDARLTDINKLKKHVAQLLDRLHRDGGRLLEDQSNENNG